MDKDKYTQKYIDYLTSNEWKLKAQERQRIDGYKCQLCGSPKGDSILQVHHITYRTLYHEDIYKDLITLCIPCHKNIHKMMNRITDEHGTRGWRDTLSISNIANKLD